MTDIIKTDNKQKSSYKRRPTIKIDTDYSKKLQHEKLQHEKLNKKIKEMENKRKKKIYTKKCDHGRQKHQCRDCGGSNFCSHGRIKYTCRDCGNRTNCSHGKIKNNCIDCRGNNICCHGKQKSNCVQCEGSNICCHKKRKDKCVECGGSSICSHGRIRQQCRDCGGGSICSHGKQKHQCIECGGSSICSHGKHKYTCHECKGSNICCHNKQIQKCRECKGSSICNHGIVRNTCHTCDFPIHPENWCKVCNYINIQRSPHKPYCFRCYCMTYPDAKIKGKYKLKEHHLRDELQKHYKNTVMIFDKRIDNGCSLRRPDVRIELLTHTLIIECDENKHKGYSCENKRTMEIFQDLGNRPIVFIRFNPDSYKDENGNIINGCFKKTTTIDNSLIKKEWTIRINKLQERIDYYINNIPTKEVTIEQLFY